MLKVVNINESNAKLSDFDLFWEIYPKRRAKLDALKAWNQTEKIRPPIEELLASIYKQEQSPDWQKDNGAYIPYPATFLRGGRWMDED